MALVSGEVKLALDGRFDNMEGLMRLDIRPREMPGRNWHLIAVWREYDASSGLVETDIWISGDLEQFRHEYEAGERPFELFSVASDGEVSVNGAPIASAGEGTIPHVPERRVVVDGNSGGIDVRITAGYGPVVEGSANAVLVRTNPDEKPGVTVELWAPVAVVNA